ncbi:MAG: polyketide cyclase / dehydrase and lipid transport [Frankiales bacterium]|nr:polyketide cyclase / dehydrase and lipid transport [Frankiales bacterium]
MVGWLARPLTAGQTRCMTDSSRFVVTVSRVIPAQPQQLFDLVADPRRHPDIDGGGTVRRVQPGGPDRLSLGASFGMQMHLAADYKVLNTVVEFVEPLVIAWRHFNGHIWRYRFTPVNGRTEVVEEWDARQAKARRSLLLLGFPRRNRAAMTASLANLEVLATQQQSQ